MLKTKEIITVIIITLASSFSAQALAAGGFEPGWYVGADFGHTEIKPDNEAFLSNKDISDTVFSIHGGYRVNPYFAIEATYADMGDYSYRAYFCPDVCIPEGTSFEISSSSRRFDLALVGSIPLGERFEAYAKVGFSRAEVESEFRSLDSISFQSKDSSTDAFYGVGLRLHFDTPWSLRLQWDRTQLGDYESDIDALWLGAEYRFSGR
jgi:OmpA-OmpF porin, OOP family